MSELQLQLTGAFQRDEAIARVRSQYQDWIDAYGAPCLYRFCQRTEFFTTDEVWLEFAKYPSPAERRVMGALIRGFAMKGLIVKTGVTEKSVMPQCHARDKAVWRSTIFSCSRRNTAGEAGSSNSPPIQEGPRLCAPQEVRP